MNSRRQTRLASAIGFLVVFGVMLLAACGGAPNDGVIHFGMASAPAKLDPRLATDATSERVDRLLYVALVDFDCAFRPVPKLASWDVVAPDHYRFHLAPTMRTFHDGSQLTARDVKATYDSILDVATGSPHRNTLAVIREIVVVDDDTVDFFLVHADSQFPAYVTIGIMPERLLKVAHPFVQHPIGSGPFKFVAWPEEGRLRLQRIADAVPFEFLRIQDPSVRVLKLIRGEVDLLQNDLMPELEHWLATRDDVMLQRHVGSNFTYLGFNMQDPIVGKREVREAIAHAIDREAILRFVFGGKQRPAQSIFPPEHWAAAADLQPYRFDPESSKRLLAAAGYSQQNPLRLVYKTSNDPFRVRLATIMQSQLAAVGIDVDLRSYDWGTFYGDIKAGRFQMFSLSWVGIKSPDIFRYAFHSASISPVGANRGHFADAEVDALIARGEKSAAGNEQRQIYRDIQRRVLQQLPYVPLWYEDHVMVSRPNIRGYTMATDGNWDGLANVYRAEKGVPHSPKTGSEATCHE